MKTIEIMHAPERSDTDLVTAALAGKRDAFRRIVERYQSLICALAFSVIGSVSQSEEVAQETFLSAWKDLRQLREPDKLHAWLCGIARHRVRHTVRAQRREPSHGALPLENAQNWPGNDALPSEQVSRRDEEEILWRTLERIPELYRVPLILFYREHQSVESVALKLDLSEEVVRKRLSRGRILLSEEVTAFVEKTLRRTAPSQAFSSSVMGTLSHALGPSTKLGFMAFWLATPFFAPIGGIFGAITAQWFIALGLPPGKQWTTKLVGRLLVGWLLLMAIAMGGIYALQQTRPRFKWTEPIMVPLASNSALREGKSGPLFLELAVPLIIGTGAGVFLREVLKRKGGKVGEGSRLGVNFSPDLKCPCCGTSPLRLRVPKNVTQMLWGGATCTRCGTEYDKWSKRVAGKRTLEKRL